MKKSLVLLALCATALSTSALVSTPALAQCNTVTPAGTVRLARDSEGKSYFVPVMVNGARKLMLLSTSGNTIFLSEAVDAMGMPAYDLRGASLATAVGAKSFAITHTTTVSIGNAKVPGDYYALFPAQADGATLYKSNIVGWLGTDILTKYDVELDLAGTTLNLYDNNACTGAPRAGAQSAAFTIDTKGRLVVPVTLDGHKLNGVIDTSSDADALNLGVAQEAMGLDVNARGVEKLADQPGSGAKTYRKQFASLSFDGVSVANPSVVLIEDKLKGQIRDELQTGTNIRMTAEENRMPDFLIGNALLSKYRIYIASREGRIYFTPR